MKRVNGTRLSSRSAAHLLLALALQALPLSNALAQDWYASDVYRTIEKYRCPELVPPATTTYLATRHGVAQSKVARDLQRMFGYRASAAFSGGDPRAIILRNEELFSDHGFSPHAPDPSPKEAYAQFQLARRLTYERGRTADALRWATLAAKQGHIGAAGLLLELARPVPPFDAIALERGLMSLSGKPGPRLEIRRTSDRYILVARGASPGEPFALQGPRSISKDVGEYFFLTAARILDDPDLLDDGDASGFLEVTHSGKTKRVLLEAASDHGIGRWAFDQYWDELRRIEIATAAGCNPDYDLR